MHLPYICKGNIDYERETYPFLMAKSKWKIYANEVLSFKLVHSTTRTVFCFLTFRCSFTFYNLFDVRSSSQDATCKICTHVKSHHSNIEAIFKNAHSNVVFLTSSSILPPKCYWKIIIQYNVLGHCSDVILLTFNIISWLDRLLKFQISHKKKHWMRMNFRFRNNEEKLLWWWYIWAKFQALVATPKIWTLSPEFFPLIWY